MADKKQTGLRSKLHAIMSGIESLPKDGYNQFQKYAYTTDRAIKEAVHAGMVEHGVLFRLVEVDQSVIEKPRADGAARSLTLIHMRYEFSDVETGEAIEGSICAQGEDAGDKGIYKAITGAIKYAMTTTFMIPAGDDAEQEEAERQSRPQASQPKPKFAGDPKNGGISEPQAKRLYAIMMKAGFLKGDVEPWLAERGYSRMGEIPRSEYDVVVAAAEKGPAKPDDFGGITSDEINWGVEDEKKVPF